MFLEKHLFTAWAPSVFPQFFIDEGKCTGCGRCVQSCPMQLLELAEKIPKSNDRYDCFRCIACQNCKAVCPTNAITIKGEYRVLKGYWKNIQLILAVKAGSFCF